MYTHSVSESYSEIPAPRTTEKASLTNIVPKTLCSRFPIELIVSLIAVILLLGMKERRKYMFQHTFIL